MKCLRCGHCCIEYDVIIVDNPDLGVKDGNIVHKPSGERCKHLVGGMPGEYSCAIHDKEWYPETPCFRHTQIESSPETPCRVGEWMLEHR